jgi:hypothetical protein
MRSYLSLGLRSQRHHPKPERVLARRDHRQGKRPSSGHPTQMLGFKPCAKSGIEYFRLILPEIRRQVALDLEMIQLQFNEGDSAREIALNVGSANVQSSNSTALALRFDYHMPTLKVGMFALKVWNDVSLGSSVARSHSGTQNSE